MKRALILAIAAAPAAAGTTSQTASFSYDGLSGSTIITQFDAFDDMGGTRQLTGVEFLVQGTAQWDVTALNYGAAALEPGDWSAEGIANFNVIFGDIGVGPERIVGAVSFSGLTGTLGAGSGSPFGPPGDPTVSASYTGAIVNSLQLNANEFGAFTAGLVTTNMISFTDAIITGGGLISVNSDALSAAGDITLTYLYVPAPASAGLLALGATAAVRRRR